VQVANDVYNMYGQELVITSVCDGKHSYTSLHYTGCAFDCRIRYFTTDEQLNVALDIQNRLGKDFDVIAETDHIHIEYQPRK